MAGFTDANTGHLTRSQLWSSDLKEVLEDSLMAQGYVRWLSEFPDGDTFNIPSIGQAVVRDYVEDTAVTYDALDTGNFQFTIGEYIHSGTYISNKQKQDVFYLNELVSSFVPKQKRAIDEHIETNIMALALQQTSGNLNTINGAPHRFVGTGSGNDLALADIAKAVYSLKKAAVPQVGFVGIVDPSVEFTMNTLTNLVNLSNNPTWDGIISTGHGSSMRFMKSIYGVDLYTSNYLATSTETVNSVSITNGFNNMFFSSESSVLPFVGAWRQMPTVESEYNKDMQRDEYVTIARYGTKLYRPENLVVVLTNANAAL